ncbi:hypothetical protein ZWY2020_010326 [Hordeum vulgare]|nr:hypothetical protein ZWY2020_010326 [Hordeum vulgare]
MLAAAVVAALVAVAWCAVPPVSFTVEKGSEEKKLALQIKYDKEGDSMKEVEVKQGEEWLPLNKCANGVWEIKVDEPLKGPYSIRYETEKGQRNVDDVVPAEYKIGTTYKPAEPKSEVNVIDANTMSADLVAVDQPVPYGFHAFFFKTPGLTHPVFL